MGCAGRVQFSCGVTKVAGGYRSGTDILLGYHSEEGWTAAIHLVTGHYGAEVEVRSLAFLCQAKLSHPGPDTRQGVVLSGLIWCEKPGI